MVMPSVETLTNASDVTGVQFAGEKDVVLFIPGSGDILRCSAIEWASVRQLPQRGSSELELTLHNLGALQP